MNAPDTSSSIARGNDFKAMLSAINTAGSKLSIVVALGYGYYNSVCDGSESIDCMYHFVKTWDKVVPGSMDGVVISGIESTTTAVSSAPLTLQHSKGSYTLGLTLPMGTLSYYQEKYIYDSYYLLLMDFWCPSITSYAATNPNNVFKTHTSDLGPYMLTTTTECSGGGGEDSPIPQKDIMSINSKTVVLWSTRHSGTSCPYPLNDGTCTKNDRAELGTVDTSIDAINLIHYMSTLFTSAKHGFYYMSLMPDSWFYYYN